MPRQPQRVPKLWLPPTALLAHVPYGLAEFERKACRFVGFRGTRLCHPSVPEFTPLGVLSLFHPLLCLLFFPHDCLAGHGTHGLGWTMVDREGASGGGMHNELSGVVDSVVQARDIHVHGAVHQSRGSGWPVPRQLPPDVSHFIGRDGELGRLDAVLDGQGGAVVVSAVAGAGGMGKTSLVVRWAHRVRDRFPDGELWVNLRGFDSGPPVSAGQALDGFLRALGVVGERIPHDLGERVGLFRSLVAGRRLLVVLDNAASAEQVRPLLPGSLGCVVVVTSRSRLSGLVARDGAQRINLDVLPPGEAVALLRQVIGPIGWIGSRWRWLSWLGVVLICRWRCGLLLSGWLLVRMWQWLMWWRILLSNPSVWMCWLLRMMRPRRCGPCFPGLITRLCRRLRVCFGCWACIPDPTSVSRPLPR